MFAHEYLMSDKAEKIFAEAIELTGEALESHLQCECGADADLRREVEVLLEDAKLADDYFGLECETVSMTSGALSEPSLRGVEKAGDTIGAFELLEKIGEGGFGLVFLARQRESIERTVALKVLKPGMDSKEVLARFAAERQALAMLDHPNIARVFDAGMTEGGRPFFVMEWVDGTPLTQFCDDRKLTVRERLKIFEEICAAIQHAHQKGVIHRDIKPSNILVSEKEGSPVVKVIDFGIAKSMNQSLTDRTLFTARGQLLGTPQYMSPEQSSADAMDIDTRSDIYSLGVVLYELVTGRAPFDPARLKRIALDEVVRIIREEEPARPSIRWQELSKDERTELTEARGAKSESRIRRQVRGDLDKIVMKSLEKDRERRYDSVADFAADVRRFLNCEPVEARAASGLYRFRKYARRNKGKVAAATVLIGAFLVLVPFSILAAMLATDEKKRSVAAAEEAAAVVEFFRDNVLAAANPVSEGGMGVETTIYEAVTGLESKLAGAFVDRPNVEASIRKTLGQTFLVLGETLRAIQELEAAVRILKKTEGMGSHETWAAMVNLASAFDTDDSDGRAKEGIALLEEVFDARMARSGLNHGDTREVLRSLAFRYERSGQTEKAKRLRQIEVDHFRAEVESLAAKFGKKYPPALTAMHHLADALESAGGLDEAIAIYLETISHREEILGKNHDHTLDSMSNLAYLYRRQGGASALVVKMRKEIFERRLASQGESDVKTLSAMERLAFAYGDDGQAAKALELAEECLSRRDALGMPHKAVFDFYLPRWKSKVDPRQSPDPFSPSSGPVEDVELEVANAVAKWGKDSPEALGAMDRLAESLKKNGDAAGVGELLTEIAGLRRQAFGEYHEQTLRAMRSLGSWKQEFGEIDTAIEINGKVLDRMRDSTGPSSRETIHEKIRLAELCFLGGHFDEAEKLGTELLESYRTSMKSSSAASESGGGIFGLSELEARVDGWSELFSHPVARVREEAYRDLRTHVDRILSTESTSNSESFDMLMKLEKDFKFGDAHTYEASSYLARIALEKAKLVKGPSSPEVVDLVERNCNFLRLEGREDETFNFFMKELENILNAEDSPLLRAEELIERLYWIFNRSNQSEKNIERAERILALVSPRRPPSLLSLLSYTYSASGRGGDAIKIAQEVVELAEKGENVRTDPFGPGTSSIEESKISLARFYEESGRTSEAIRIYEQVLDSRKVDLNSPQSIAENLVLLADLAKWLKKDGRREEGDSIQSSLAGHAAKLLANCPAETATLPRLKTLAKCTYILKHAERLHESEELEETLRSEIETYIAESPAAFGAKSEWVALSECISAIPSGNLDTAADRLKEFAREEFKSLLSDHASGQSGLSPDCWSFLDENFYRLDPVLNLEILEAITSLYFEHRLLNNYPFESFDEELLNHYRQSGVISEEEKRRVSASAKGDTLVERLESFSAIGQFLARRGKYEWAEARLLYAHRGLEVALFSTERERLSGSFERLISLYAFWGKPDKADQWKGRLEEFRKGLQ